MPIVKSGRCFAIVWTLRYVYTSYCCYWRLSKTSIFFSPRVVECAAKDEYITIDRKSKQREFIGSFGGNRKARKDGT